MKHSKYLTQIMDETRNFSFSHFRENNCRLFAKNACENLQMLTFPSVSYEKVHLVINMRKGAFLWECLKT
jgi:hypothetical protein